MADREEEDTPPLPDRVCYRRACGRPTGQRPARVSLAAAVLNEAVSNSEKSTPVYRSLGTEAEDGPSREEGAEPATASANSSTPVPPGPQPPTTDSAEASEDENMLGEHRSWYEEVDRSRTVPGEGASSEEDDESALSSASDDDSVVAELEAASSTVFAVGSKRPRPPPVKQTSVPELQCAFCMDNEANVLFIPCQHLLACWPCTCKLEATAAAARAAGQAPQGKFNCPTCRGPVVGAMAVHRQREPSPRRAAKT